MGGFLLISLVKPSYNEIRGVLNDRIKVKLDTLEDVMMFTIKFGGGLLFDAPYSPQLSRDDVDFNDIPEGKGLSLHIIVSDSMTGEVKGIRAIGLSNKFSKDIARAVADIRAKPFNEEKYNDAINRIYDKYSLEEIFKNSKNYCTI